MGIRIVGRPKKYSTKEQLQEKIQYYFDSITIDRPAIEVDEDGNEKPILNNAGEQIIYVEFIKQPSVIGLCLFLGIHRETLKQYELMDEFSDTIREAKQIIVNQKLEMLPLMKNPRGLMFDLSANYGMHEKVQTELSGKVEMPVIKIEK